MGDSTEGFGSGILRGLKKVLFTEEKTPEPARVPAPENPPSPPVHIPEQRAVSEPGAEPDRDMKLRVYQLLETLNQPGVDFFEVWNAAVEMGGVNSQHIRSAFTSLRFADKNLSKQRLIDSGQQYISKLSAIIEKEAQQRQEEKSTLLREKEEVRKRLQEEIRSMQEQIALLQKQLTKKEDERQRIDATYDPRVSDIETKIRTGRQSVDSVLAEMRQVLQIIQADIN